MTISRTPFLALGALVLALCATGCAVSVTDPEGADLPVSSGGEVSGAEQSTPSDDPEELGVSDGSTATVTCEGERVLRADSAVITIDGSCNAFTIAGDFNTVIAEDITTLTVQGASNTVFTETIDALEVDGDNNTITWSGSTPSISDNGTNNVLAP